MKLLNFSLTVLIALAIIITPPHLNANAQNPAEMEQIYQLAKAVAILKGDSYAANFKQTITSINCEKVSCEPVDICKYLSLGSGSPVIANALCQNTAEALKNFNVREDIDIQLILEIKSTVPDPEVCQEISGNPDVLTPTGTLILNPDTYSTPKVRECIRKMVSLYEYIDRNRDECLSIIKSYRFTPLLYLLLS